MKILLMSNLYPPYYLGGYELRCKETADELEKRGNEITVLTSTWGIGRPEVDKNIYRLLNINPLMVSQIKNRPDFLRLGRRVNLLKWAVLCRKNYTISRRLIQAIKPDIVYLWNMGNIGVTPVIAAQEQGIPIIYSLGDYWLAEIKQLMVLDPSLLKRKYWSIILGLKDFNHLDLKYLITNSNTLKKKYVDKGFPQQNIEVIPRGIPAQIIIDNDLISSRIKNVSKINKLIYVGRLSPEKGPDLAIEAFKILIDEMGLKSLSLDFIGTGSEDYMNMLKELTVTLRIDKRVNFLGKMEHQKVIEQYCDHQILVFPSKGDEPFGVAILEAMARGVPVIATDRGSSPEIISDGQNGLIVPGEDPFSLAQAVRRLLNDRDLVQNLRKAAIKTIREKYTQEEVVNRIQVFLQATHKQFITTNTNDLK